MVPEGEFENILRDAKAGDEKSITLILRMIEPIVEKNSIVNGCKDEDLYQILLLKTLDLLDKFQI